MSEASSPVKSFLAGGAGGMAAVIVGQPFDMVKVQLQNSTKYKGMADCATVRISNSAVHKFLQTFQAMIKQGGPLSLYRGVAAPLVGVAPIFALSFAGNAAGQNIVRTVTGHKKLSYFEYFLGGSIAGIYSTVIMAPGERIKV